MRYSTRPASEADYPYCYRLTKRNMFDLFCRHWGGWVPSEFRKSFEPVSVTMIIVNGRRAGYLSVKRDKQGIYLENIQLSPLVQGRGMGTNLLRQVLERHSQDTIRLTTFLDNPAKRLYEHLGFSVVEHEGEVIRMTKPSGNCSRARHPID